MAKFPLRTSGYRFYLDNIFSFFGKRHFKGWGRKKTGRFAVWCAKRSNGTYTLQEDGFLRSVGLGVDGAPAFSVVKDDMGIYYDATQPSRLEDILNHYDFEQTPELMQQAEIAIGLILKHRLSKYNHAADAQAEWFSEDSSRVLVIAQTGGDESLQYGYGNRYSTIEMVQAAISENPNAIVYLKVHPDVLSGKKEGDFSVNDLPAECRLLQHNANPISLLDFFDKVYTKTSLMGFEALLAGKEVVCFGFPFYAGWGLTDDRVTVSRRKRTLTVAQVFAAAYILYSHYKHPMSGRSLTILEAIDELVWYRDKYRESQSFDKAFFFGFSRWKHGWLKYFFDEIRPEQFRFVNPIFGKNHLELAKRKGLSPQSRIYIWGRREFPLVETFAKQNQLPVYRVEDGFVRSISLGSDLTQPYSLVVDSRGIYFDPTQSSDLEVLLTTYDFAGDSVLLKRAEAVIEDLVARKISKYNVFDHQRIILPDDKKVILVPGQVEDDASIQYGADGMSNLALLKAVRKIRPDAHIIFKPHPDVVVGNRIGNIASHIALQYCDSILVEVSIDSLLQSVDEVHTMTSLVGFEALLRKKKVVTYGKPFYAGWGLTEDRRNIPSRKRILSLPELAAGVLLLYPRYIQYGTKVHCSLEILLDSFDLGLQEFRSSRRRQIIARLRNSVIRSAQKILRIIKKLGQSS